MNEIEGETYDDMPMEHKKYYPRISLTAKELPAIANWKVGESYMLLVEVKQIASSEIEEGDEKIIRADFEFHKVGTLDDMSKADFSKLLAKAKSGDMS